MKGHALWFVDYDTTELWEILSEFTNVTTDESTHQILSYGLLFLTFYRFPYTAGPPTSTALTRPSPTFAQSPPTMPYTHHTIGLVPRQRPLI